MKFTIEKDMIINVLQYIASFTISKNINANILQNVFIKAENNSIEIKATNFQISFLYKVAANVKVNGSVTVSAKKLSEIVKEMPDIIDFTYDGSKLNITANNISFQLPTMDYNLFPKFPDVTEEFHFNIKTKDFIRLIDKVSFSISNDMSKIEYTGAHLNIFSSNMELIGVDLQRVAFATTQIENSINDELTVNIPKKTLTDISKLFENDEYIKIVTDKKHISIIGKDKTITSRLIEKYIKNINKLFTRNYSIKAVVNKYSLSEALKRVSVVTSNITKGVCLNFSGQNIIISSLESEYGEGTEVIENIDFKSNMIKIYLNAKHFIEVLSVIESDHIIMHMESSAAPILVTPDKEGYKYIVVPLSIENVR